MGKFEWSLQGLRNQLKEHAGFIQWISFSFETGFTKKKLNFVSSHLWLFGFQIFELSVNRKKD
jgi:hypothetical protein